MGGAQNRRLDHRPWPRTRRLTWSGLSTRVLAVRRPLKYQLTQLLASRHLFDFRILNAIIYVRYRLAVDRNTNLSSRCNDSFYAINEVERMTNLEKLNATSRVLESCI